MNKDKINKLLLSDVEDDVRIGFELAMKYYPGNSYTADNHSVIAFIYQEKEIVVGINGSLDTSKPDPEWNYLYYRGVDLIPTPS